MKTFFSLWLLCPFAFAAPLATLNAESAFFQCQLINVASTETNKSRLIISVGLPLDALSFVKSGQSYEARFGLSIGVLDRDGFGVAEREVQQRLQAQTFAETNASTKFYFDLFEFDLMPGEYETIVTVTDAVSGRRSSFTAKKVLQDFAAAEAKLALSDIIITNRMATDSAGKPEISPGLFQNRAAPAQPLHFYFEINARLDEAPMQVRQIIRDGQKEIVVDQKRPWQRQAALEKIMLPIYTDHLPYGVYELEIQVQHGKAKKTAKQEFHVIWNGIPESGIHVRQALEQAALVANDAERREVEKIIADSSLAAQRSALIAFWSKRDDSPSAENKEMTAFYQRVEVANEKFGGRRIGWKTDLGKVFIQLGTPDAIEVDSDHPRQQRAQIWRYHSLHRHFLFVDPSGFGDFVLAQEQRR